jgi:hypothetical protein
MKDVDASTTALEAGEGDPADLAAAIDAAVQTAPADMKDAVDTMADRGRQLVSDADAATESGTTQPQNGSPDIPPDSFFSAQVTASEYMAENCDYENVDVKATDHEFDGLDGDIKAGTALISFTNDGAEYHEIDVEKLKDGEQRSVEELLQLVETSPDEASALVTPVALTFAPPGSGSYTIANLEPGRYLAMCHIPVGATPEALEGGAPLDESDAHLLHGMITDFTVS